MKNNTIARRSLTKGAAQARRLLANVSLASSVTDATYELDITAQVKKAIAVEDFRLGALIVREGERFCFVASKFVGRYYVLINRDGRWMSSSNDSRVTAQLVERMQGQLAQVA